MIQLYGTEKTLLMIAEQQGALSAYGHGLTVLVTSMAQRPLPLFGASTNSFAFKQQGPQPLSIPPTEGGRRRNAKILRFAFRVLIWADFAFVFLVPLSLCFC